MAATAVAVDLFQALDVQCDIAAKVTLSGIFVNLLTQLGELLFRQLAGAPSVIDAL